MERIDVLGRKYSDDIMMAADEPKSATELSDELGVPIATCYRRVNELTAAGFLSEHTEKTADGKTIVRFRRTTDAIDIRFDSTVSMHAWPRDTRPVNLGRFVPNSLAELNMSERVSWSGQTMPAETATTEISASRQQSEDEKETNS